MFKIQQKVFGIGMGKTGTTSLEQAFIELGLRIGPQEIFERHFDQWAMGNHEPLFVDIERFDAFQDVPFCLPKSYKVLFERYPQAKFILTLRDSADQWYESLCRFHSKVFGRDGALPTEQDLAEATYVSPGWAFRVSRVYGTPPGVPYDRKTLIGVYETHRLDVEYFFVNSSQSLLVLNPAQPDAFLQLTDFLNMPRVDRPFPHLNRYV